jgi:hypothetical protein
MMLRSHTRRVRMCSFLFFYIYLCVVYESFCHSLPYRVKCRMFIYISISIYVLFQVVQRNVFVKITIVYNTFSVTMLQKCINIKLSLS